MPLIGQDENGQHLIKPRPSDFAGLAHKITAITLGAGSRGNVYGNYAVEYPCLLYTSPSPRDRG